MRHCEILLNGLACGRFLDMAKSVIPGSMSEVEIGEPIEIVCSRCRSRDVRRDAFATWNTSAQEWELCAVFDQGYCEDCGGEARLDEVPLARKTR